MNGSYIIFILIFCIFLIVVLSYISCYLERKSLFTANIDQSFVGPVARIDYIKKNTTETKRLAVFIQYLGQSQDAIFKLKILYTPSHHATSNVRNHHIPLTNGDLKLIYKEFSLYENSFLVSKINSEEIEFEVKDHKIFENILDDQGK